MKQFTQIPALRLAIASDYEALDQLASAFQTIKKLMPSLVIATVLPRRWRACGSWAHRSQGQVDAALETSQILLQADQRASNFYGLMNTYDQIGQLYLKRGNNSEALAAFQKGWIC